MSRLLELNTPLGQDKTILMQMRGFEYLGQLPEYKLTIVAQRKNIAPDELLGKNVTAGIELPGGQALRYLNGYVTQFADAGTASSSWFPDAGKAVAYVYNLTVHPWLWFLKRSSNCRIFQQKSALDVIKEVFAAYPFAQFDDRIAGTHPTLEYCVQYRESDFNFVSRLMEREGIYYYFEHENGKHTLVLCDDPTAHSAFGGYENVSFSDASSGGHFREEHITEWHRSHQVQTGRMAISDFNFKKPSVSLLSKTGHPEGHDLDNFEVFDYPGNYDAPGEGQTYVKTRLQELQASYTVATGSGALRGLIAGHSFTLKDHPQQEQLGEYLLVSTNFDITNNAPDSTAGAGQAEFHCNFRAIPSTVSFRPLRASPVPIVQGPQTAIVVGPAGEEICVDEYGRVKVQFHWDRYNNADDKSSCWVRVSQPWAGNTWGGLFLPRVGHEVIVDFLEGDPDRPIITGRAYNASSMPPWQLPAGKTRSGIKTRTYKGSSSNFNELSFNDEKGNEEVYIHAERNKNIYIKANRSEYVGYESHLTVEKDVFEKLKADHHVTIKGDENFKLEEGSYSQDVCQNWQSKVGIKMAADAGKEIHLKAGQVMVAESGDSLTHKSDKIITSAGSNLSLKAGTQIAAEGGMNISLKSGMDLVIEAGMSITLKVGGNFIVIDQTGVAIKGTMVQINTMGMPGSPKAPDDPVAGSGSQPTAPKPAHGVHGSKGGDNMKPIKPEKPADYSPQAQALKLAWQAGTPFCEMCQQ